MVAHLCLNKLFVAHANGLGIIRGVVAYACGFHQF
jgi:hypothetical protein